MGLGAPGAGPGGTSVGRGQRVSYRPGVQQGSEKECLEPLLNQVKGSRLHISSVFGLWGGCLAGSSEYWVQNTEAVPPKGGDLKAGVPGPCPGG